MNKIYFFLLYIIFSTASFVKAQSTASLGSKTLYRPLQSTYTVIPRGYKPLYINFIGRHAARHLSKDVKAAFAYKILRKADSLQMLTANGITLRKMVLNLDRIEEKEFASISKIGAEELEGIAKRMYRQENAVFSGEKTSLLVATTKKGRTKESAEAFLNGLKTEKISLIDNVKFNYADDVHLRFYDFSKSYDEFKEKGAWMPVYQQLAKSQNLNLLSENFTSKIFKSKFLKALSKDEKLTFVDDVYGFYTILNAIEKEIKVAGFKPTDLNFKKYFSSSDLVSLSLLGDAEDFLTKGPGTNANGIQVRIAVPLLVDFLATADEFLKTGTVKANLRFAHAETIAPFAAIMNIKGASESAKNIKNFNQLWQAERVIPFSANIQWIFYKNESTGGLLVKFLLNEKEAAINGLNTKTYPYYNWIDVRAFYLKKLKELKVNPKDDMHQYLLQLN